MLKSLLRFTLEFAVILGVIFAALEHFHSTLAPVDLYLITDQMYSPGDSIKQHNGYLTDITDVYLPWKYFSSQLKPKVCSTSVTSKLGTSSIDGILLPQGYCYPLGAVRSYFYFDVFHTLSKFFDFFTAYNLSYYLLLLWFFLASMVFFQGFFPDQTAAALGAMLTVSFSVARDLQYDGIVIAFPFLLISLRLLNAYVSTEKKIFLIGSSLFLWISIIKNSLQALGFCLLFFSLFAILRYRIKLKPFLVPLTFSVGLVALAGVWHHTPAIHIFLKKLATFLPSQDISLPLQIVKRTLAGLLSLVQFTFGDMLFSFSTIDFAKSLGNLGAREYFSYDGAAFFINPACGIFLLSWIAAYLRKDLSHRQRQAMKLFAVALLVDFLIFQLPTYRLLYFRFHQWWLTLNFLLLLGEMTEVQTWRRYFFPSLFLVIAMNVASSFIIESKANFILANLSGKGSLGFENGFWDLRLAKWISRARFQDWYSVTFVIFAVLIFYSWTYRRGLFFISALAGLSLNIFNYNFPQSRETFYVFQQKLKEDPNPTTRRVSRSIPGNYKLFINEPPQSIYESLNVDLPKE